MFLEGSMKEYTAEAKRFYRSKIWARTRAAYVQQAADVHISLAKNLNAIVKQLLDLVPPAQRKSKLEELMDT